MGRETPGTACACIVCAEVKAETKRRFIASGMSEATATALAEHFWPEPDDETPPGTIEATTPARPSAPAPLPGSKPLPVTPGRVEVTLVPPKKPRES